MIIYINNRKHNMFEFVPVLCTIEIQYLSDGNSMSFIRTLEAWKQAVERANPHLGLLDNLWSLYSSFRSLLQVSQNQY